VYIRGNIALEASGPLLWWMK